MPEYASLLLELGFSEEDFESEIDFIWSLDDYEVMEEGIVDHSRWSVQKTKVVKIKDRFIRVDWSVGATEYQDEDPHMEVKEVFPKKRVVFTYE